MDSTQTPIVQSEVIAVTIPGRSNARISNEHRLRLVCGLAVYNSTDIAESPTGGPKANTPVPACTVDLVEVGTMTPRIKGLPLPRLCNSEARPQQVAEGAEPVGMGLQPFRMRYGPGIDLGASRIYNTAKTKVTVYLEIFYGA